MEPAPQQMEQPDPTDTPDDPGGDPEGRRQDVGDADRKDASWLALELAKIACFGDVSEASMEKVTKLFMGNLQEITAIRQRGEVTDSYRHTIKHRLNIWQPRVKCAIKFVNGTEDDEEPQQLRDLDAIPAKYLQPTLGHHYIVLRSEAYTSLSDMKKHYEETHPHVRGEELRNAYRSTSLGIDGVREANSGSRTLIVVSLMFNGCVFIWKIFNPYKGDARAKPTLEELLRPLVTEVNGDDDIFIRHLVADMLERHHCRGLVSHSGYYSCEYCLARAASPNAGGVNFQFDGNWDKELRTNESWKEIAR